MDPEITHIQNRIAYWQPQADAIRESASDSDEQKDAKAHRKATILECIADDHVRLEYLLAGTDGSGPTLVEQAQELAAQEKDQRLVRAMANDILIADKSIDTSDLEVQRDPKSDGGFPT